ncbi:MAG: hypothetical protein U9Q34_01390 [Elusimicrobiota bacterium]|nr:hypothetical protein [Elusimicrobiota bacterium]
MTKKIIFAGLILSVIFAVVILTHKKPESNFNKLNFSKTKGELEKLETYIRRVKKDENTFYFDYKKALNDGFSEEIVILQREMINHQNEMLEKFKVGLGNLFDPIDSKKYPRFAEYNRLKSKYYTEYHKNKKREIGDRYLTMDLGDIERQVREMEPYVKYVVKDGVRLQVFDDKAALKNKKPKETIMLIKEIVAAQNEMMKKIKAGRTDVFGKVDIKKYPRIAKWHKAATNFHNIREGKMKSEYHACGTEDYPVPDYTPLREYSTSKNPEKTLLDLGFHHTAAYACGEYGKSCSDKDFTKGRGYRGDYGYCDSPIFRNHGYIEGEGQYSIQYGEPNPEIYTYEWPYMSWPIYVNEWHEKY